ncbi:MAG: non-canonical purine NTP pyrophosphatase [Candidatus Eremiobacteraeota bacterium]|nr:non-canonical purine NTP pyrophosphatase [Candidatus Eremiobacteraeota bacterium]
MHLYAATKNTGKLVELRTLFAAAGWRVDTFDDYADVAEGDASYALNAAAKAAALQRQLRAAGVAAPTLGDDSGLEVSALGGRPGVLSARYCGLNATWSERRAALLSELAAAPSTDRSARFVCALHYIDEAGTQLSVERDVAGSVPGSEAGTGGFSYDAVFFYEPLGKTFGEMTDAQKNGISHRARAVAALVELIRARGGAGAGARPEIRLTGGNRRSDGM